MKLKSALIALILAAFLGGFLFAKFAVPQSASSHGKLLEPASHKVANGVAAGKLWVCPMHPQIVQDHPGACPICGMDLAAAEGGASSDHSELHVDSATQQSMGLRAAEAKAVTLGQPVDTFGVAAHDEKRIYQVTPHTSGLITRMHVVNVGQELVPGQALYDIYSGELLEFQNEYVDYLHRSEATYGSIKQTKAQNEKAEKDLQAKEPAYQNQVLRGIAQSNAQVRLMGLSLYRDRTRITDKLLYAGFTPSMLETLKKTEKNFETVTVHASKPCLVTQIGARTGSAVDPMTQVLSCADNANLWLIVTLYPEQLAQVKAGDPVKVKFTGLDMPEMTGRLELPDSIIDPATQTLKARVMLPNHDKKIPPGAVAQVTISTQLRKTLAVPGSAVIRTGKGDYVMLALGKNHFLPTAVETGLESDGWIEIKDGLQEGAKVVVNGNFLLDAASSLADTVQRMQSGKQN